MNSVWKTAFYCGSGCPAEHPEQRVEAGLKLAIRRLYEQKAANNETAVISVNGEIKHIPAKELLKKYDK